MVAGDDGASLRGGVPREQDEKLSYGAAALDFWDAADGGNCGHSEIGDEAFVRSKKNPAAIDDAGFSVETEKSTSSLLVERWRL